MSSLKTVSWGNGANKLLSRFINQDLLENTPTILMLRHSEREEPEKLEDVFDAPLTERGHKIAYEFGKNLPKKFNYRFFHSPVERCKNTAIEIKKGVSNSNPANPALSCPIDCLENLHIVNCDFEKFKTHLKQANLKFLDYWIGQFYNPVEIEPALAVAKRMAQDIKNIIETQENGTIDVFVSHDFHVIVSQFYLTGVLATKEWIQYLDGYIIQFLDEKMILYYKTGKYEIKYPYWWKK